MSIAIYGESPVFAGFFEGDVYINGELKVESGAVHIVKALIVDGNLHVHGQSFDQLLKRVAALEALNSELQTKIASLEELKITIGGPPVVPTMTRAFLKITEKSNLSNNITWRLIAEGTGFTGVGEIQFTVLNVPQAGQLNKTHGFTVLPFPGTQIVKSDGTLGAHLNINADLGDKLIISAH